MWGDAFNVVINTRPVYRDDKIALDEVAAGSDGKNGYYIRRVCTAPAASDTTSNTRLPRSFQEAPEEPAMPPT